MAKRFKNRKGYTLFELMIVAIIIIILSAIAIPNYLHLKYKASEARAYEDFSFIGYLLEIYKIDWGAYPVVEAGEFFGKNADGSELKSTLSIELTGSGKSAPYVNIPGKKTLTGHLGPIEYFEASRIVSLYNPFNPSQDYHYQSDSTGSEWVLYLSIGNGKVLYRTVTQVNLTEAPEPPVP